MRLLLGRAFQVLRQPEQERPWKIAFAEQAIANQFEVSVVDDPYYTAAFLPFIDKLFGLTI